jgi:predicted nucleic acid-binding protein
MTIEAAISGLEGIVLDTAPIVYHLENNARYHGQMSRLFMACRDAGVALITSPITLSECLVHPFRMGGLALVHSYHELLTRGEGVRFWSIGEDEALRAAKLRADHNLTLADALQAAVAQASGVAAILTNDAVFKRVAGLHAVILSEVE